MSSSSRPFFNDDTPVGSFVRRNGTILGAAGAALVAVILLVVALGGKGDSASTPAATKTSVLVAKSTIARGTVLSSGAAADALRVKRVSGDQAQAGAITSLSAVHGMVATQTITAGDQITSDVVSNSHSTVISNLSDSSRGITVPIDSSHGMVGDITSGDRVDVYASFSDPGSNDPVLKAIAQDIKVLRAPTAIDGSQGNDAKATAQVTLDLPDGAAQRAAWAADNGKVWIAARPASGSSSTRSAVINAGAMLKGTAAKGHR
jgi:Flp pilus assembly protein CpaB